MKAGRSGMSITLLLRKFDDSKKYHSAPLKAKICCPFQQCWQTSIPRLHLIRPSLCVKTFLSSLGSHEYPCLNIPKTLYAELLDCNNLILIVIICILIVYLLLKTENFEGEDSCGIVFGTVNPQ